MNHTRHSGIFDVSSISVGLVGAGGIGAITAVALAKIGIVYLDIWDDDEISEENLATQLHRVSDKGRTKVWALRDLVKEFSDDIQIEDHDYRFGATSFYQGTILISAVDSIAARKSIFEGAVHNKIHWYLDARMGAETFHLHTVDMSSPDAWQWYDRLLAGEDDTSIPDLPCTSKATFYTASFAAGHIANAVKRLGMGQDQPRILIHDIRNDALTVIP